jgi:hypothetical protein
MVEKQSQTLQVSCKRQVDQPFMNLNGFFELFLQQFVKKFKIGYIVSGNFFNMLMQDVENL